MTILPQLDLLAAMFGENPAGPASTAVNEEPCAAFTDVFDDVLSPGPADWQDANPRPAPAAKRQRDVELDAAIWNAAGATNPIASVQPPVNQPLQLDMVPDAVPPEVVVGDNREDVSQQAEQETLASAAQQPLNGSENLIRPPEGYAGYRAASEPQLLATAPAITAHPRSARSSESPIQPESQIEPAAAGDEPANREPAIVNSPASVSKRQTDVSPSTKDAPVSKGSEEQEGPENGKNEARSVSVGNPNPLHADPPIIPAATQRASDLAGQFDAAQSRPQPAQPSQHGSLQEKSPVAKKTAPLNDRFPEISEQPKPGFRMPVPADAPQSATEVLQQKTVEGQTANPIAEELPVAQTVTKAPIRAPRKASTAAKSVTAAAAPELAFAAASPAAVPSSESRVPPATATGEDPRRSIAEQPIPASTTASPQAQVPPRLCQETSDYQTAFRARLTPAKPEPQPDQATERRRSSREQMPTPRSAAFALPDRDVASGPARPVPSHQEPASERGPVRPRPQSEYARPEPADQAEPAAATHPDNANMQPAVATESTASVAAEKPAAEPQTIHRAQQPVPSESPKAASARDLKIDLSSGASRVEVRLTDRAGEVRVDVRTTDAKLAGELRQELPSLTARLEETGYRTEAWHPVADGPAARSIESTAPPTNDSGGGTSGREQGDRREPDHRRPKDPESQSNDNQERKEFQWFVSNPQDLPRF